MLEGIRRKTLALLESLDRRHQAGKRLLVTGGPTCEDIDAVRFLSNRSTGRMGIELAAAAAARGWPTLLVLGPTALAPPTPVSCLRVRSAAEMGAAVMAAFPWCEVLVMAAAVADYTPLAPREGKLKKNDGELVLRLKRTADILAEVSRQPEREKKHLIGFALEETLELEAGKRKLEAKGLDTVVLNTPAAFGADASEVCIITASGVVDKLGHVRKSKLAAVVLDLLET